MPKADERLVCAIEPTRLKMAQVAEPHLSPRPKIDGEQYPSYEGGDVSIVEGPMLSLAQEQ